MIIRQQLRWLTMSSFGCLTPDFRSKYYSPNLVDANVIDEDRESASRTSSRPTWRNVTSIPTHGRPLPQTDPDEARVCGKFLSISKLDADKRKRKSRYGGKTLPRPEPTTQDHPFHLTTHARTATESANPVSASWFHSPIHGWQSYSIPRDRCPLQCVVRGFQVVLTTVSQKHCFVTFASLLPPRTLPSYCPTILSPSFSNVVKNRARLAVGFDLAYSHILMTWFHVLISCQIDMEVRGVKENLW